MRAFTYERAETPQQAAMAAASTDATEISALGLAGCLVSSLAQVFVNMRSKTVYTQRYTYAAVTTKSQESTEQKRNERRAVQPVELQFAISARIFSHALLRRPEGLAHHRAWAGGGG